MVSTDFDRLTKTGPWPPRAGAAGLKTLSAETDPSDLVTRSHHHLFHLIPGRRPNARPQARASKQRARLMPRPDPNPQALAKGGVEPAHRPPKKLPAPLFFKGEGIFRAFSHADFCLARLRKTNFRFFRWCRHQKRPKNTPLTRSPPPRVIRCHGRTRRATPCGMAACSTAS